MIESWRENDTLFLLQGCGGGGAGRGGEGRLAGEVVSAVPPPCQHFSTSRDVASRARELATVCTELGNVSRPTPSAGLRTGRNSVLSSYTSTIRSTPFCGRIKFP